MAGRAVGIAALLLVTAGCSGDLAAGEASSAAAAFAQAAPPAGCDLLAPDTADALAKQSGKSCAEALAALHLPTGTAVQQVEVAGESAQVRLDGQVVFLAHFPDGWKVTAAGCVRDDPDPAAPYSCEVEK